MRQKGPSQLHQVQNQLAQAAENARPGSGGRHVQTMRRGGGNRSSCSTSVQGRGEPRTTLSLVAGNRSTALDDGV